MPTASTTNQNTGLAIVTHWEKNTIIIIIVIVIVIIITITTGTDT